MSARLSPLPCERISPLPGGDLAGASIRPTKKEPVKAAQPPPVQPKTALRPWRDPKITARDVQGIDPDRLDVFVQQLTRARQAQEDERHRARNNLKHVEKDLASFLDRVGDAPTSPQAQQRITTLRAEARRLRDIVNAPDVDSVNARIPSGRRDRATLSSGFPWG